jgi:hypothetical protein
MPMLIRYLDDILDESEREEHLLIGFDIPWVERDWTSDAPRSMPQDVAEQLHHAWFEKHGIKTEVVAPPLGSGYIMGGHVTWVDLTYDDPLIKEYEAEFEIDSVSKHPDSYKAMFFTKSWWEKHYKAEWDTMKADPDKYWEDFNP